MKAILKTLATALILAFIAVSCSSDNDSNEPVTASREVKYEITGTANSDGIIVVHPKTYIFPR